MVELIVFLAAVVGSFLAGAQYGKEVEQKAIAALTNKFKSIEGSVAAEAMTTLGAIKQRVSKFL